MEEKSFVQRAEALVSQMTLEEKVSQMIHGAAAIPRLNVPDYNWWNECLHGVGRAGTATVFPQAIGMAASFDTELVHEVASAISDEARARYHAFQALGDHGQYKGLTFWTPNINIFRDPRWGRGQETYGEDPYLTGRMGVAFITGLQGDDPKYLKTAATAKHYVVHSGPEGERHSFDARVSKKDFYETYLPAFRDAVREARVEAVMGSYNRTMGEPCCGSHTYLQEVLREQLGFQGHVVSDCGAVCDFDAHHRVTATRAESAAMAVKNGCDLNCGDAFSHLLVAVQEGLLTEEDIDRAVIRLMTTRMKLGMFDPDERVPYANIPLDVVDSPEHQQLNRRIAGASLVLLKNDGVLPFGPEVKRVAVIGPTADDRATLIGNYCGTPSESVTILDGIREAAERVDYAAGCHLYRTAPVVDQDGGGITEALLAARRADAVVLCLGLTPCLEGEEGDAYNVDAGGDRVRIGLPGRQLELAQAVLAEGKPTAVVITGGSAVSMPELAENAPAILDAWYPGGQGGRAVADALFGRLNPSGRLPVTIVKSEADLPDFRDYAMKNRTYRYLETEPLFPFGFGLSYTSFAYAEGEAKREADGFQVSATVTNCGAQPGRETVQLYLRDEEASEVLPVHSLKGFRTLTLQPGESRRVTFHLGERDLAFVGEDGSLHLEDGAFTAFIGGSQPDARSAALGAPQTVAIPFRWGEGERVLPY